MAVQIPFPLPSHGYAQNSKMRVNLDFLVNKFNEFNTGTATWDTVAIGIANNETGTLTFYNHSNANYLTFQPGATGTNTTYTFPTALPVGNNRLLKSSTSGTMAWSNVADIATVVGGDLLYLDGATQALTELAPGGSDKILRSASPPAWVDLLGTTNQVSVTTNVGNYTLSLPQSIATSSNVRFNQVITKDGTITNPSIVVTAGASAENNGLISSGADLSIVVAGALQAQFDNAGNFATNGETRGVGLRTTSYVKISTGGSIVTLQALGTAFGAYTLTLPPNDGNANDVLITDGSGTLSFTSATGAAGAATKALDNLASVAINTSLLPASNNAIDLGSSTPLTFRAGYFGTSVNIISTTNQLVLGTTRTATITAPTPATSSRVYTFPDMAADYSVVATEGAQTINGAKTLSGELKITALDNTALLVTAANSGSTQGVFVVNTSNTASSDAWYYVRTGGTSAGDPMVVFNISGSTAWAVGIDNSDSDKFKISQDSALGATDYLTITTGGVATFPGQLIGKGTATNDSASAGYIGEYISSAVGSAGAVSVSNNTYADVTSITLSAGDWDVSCMVAYKAAAITGTQFFSGIGTATGNNGAGLVEGDTAVTSPYAPTAASANAFTVPAVRVSITGSTVYYLKAYALYTVGTLTAFGRISARRVR